MLQFVSSPCCGHVENIASKKTCKIHVNLKINIWSYLSTEAMGKTALKMGGVQDDNNPNVNR